MQIRLLFVFILSSVWLVVAQHSSSTSTRTTRTSTSTSTRTSASTPPPTTLRTSASTRSSITNSPNSSEPPDPTTTFITSTSSTTPTPTDGAEQKKDGLGRNDIIGLSLGIPLGSFALIATVTAFLIRKRRQRDRESIDPNAGAGKRIYDPSPELVIRTSKPKPSPNLSPSLHPPPNPGAIELPTVKSDQWKKAPNSEQNEWWRVPFGRSTPSTKYSHVGGPNHSQSQSPQELPA
ncbi:hypothetical protein B0J11DRAFT_235523 [Dendryphion nanum]|uniref:Mid2 domain-containing protein n=1 Tax=Dendryphion nanum TaxID=256645 RepID=A0A9P9CXW4_9PLEO|nr:hypothetical protein B0J11DRAFT_235523 [Dendryphion nanum]